MVQCVEEERFSGVLFIGVKSNETGLEAIADAFRYLKWIKLWSDDFSYWYMFYWKNIIICSEKKWNHSWEYLALSLMHLILNVPIPSFLFFIKYAHKYFWKTTPNTDEQSYSSKNRYDVEGNSKALRGFCRLIKCFTQYNRVILFPRPQCLITHPISWSLSLPPPHPVSKTKPNKQKKMKPQIKYPNKPKPQKNGKMSKHQNSGVHFVLAKYFWVWGLLWNAVNIHRGTFPFPSRHRL